MSKWVQFLRKKGVPVTTQVKWRGMKNLALTHYIYLKVWQHSEKFADREVNGGEKIKINKCKYFYVPCFLLVN